MDLPNSRLLALLLLAAAATSDISLAAEPAPVVKAPDPDQTMARLRDCLSVPEARQHPPKVLHAQHPTARPSLAPAVSPETPAAPPDVADCLEPGTLGALKYLAQIEAEASSQQEALRMATAQVTQQGTEIVDLQRQFTTLQTRPPSVIVHKLPIPVPTLVPMPSTEIAQVEVLVKREDQQEALANTDPPKKPYRTIEPDARIREEFPDAETIDFLIATVPDPRVPRHSRSFDNNILAIRRGMVDSGFMLDRFVLPWRAEEPEKTKTANPNSRNSDSSPQASQYGLMLFRMDAWRGNKAPSSRHERIIAIYLVPETATYGVAGKAFSAAAQRIIEQLGDHCPKVGAPGNGVPQDRPPNPSLLVIGPNFSGSVDSLRAFAIRSRNSGEHLSISAVSPSITVRSNAFANIADLFAIQSYAVSDDNKLRQAEQLIQRILTPAGNLKDQVALLTEDSAFGSGICAKGDTSSLPGLCETAWKLTFPVNIADLRSMNQEIHREQEARLPLNPFSSHRHLPLDQGSENGSEYPETEQARLTSISASVELDRAVNHLRDLQIRVVIIAATDVRDRLFLIERLRQRLPNALVIDLETDRLLGHEQVVSAARGTLTLASTPISAAYLSVAGKHLKVWADDRQANLAKIISTVADTSKKPMSSLRDYTASKKTNVPGNFPAEIAETRCSYIPELLPHERPEEVIAYAVGITGLQPVDRDLPGPERLRALLALPIFVFICAIVWFVFPGNQKGLALPFALASLSVLFVAALICHISALLIALCQIATLCWMYHHGAAAAQPLANSWRSLRDELPTVTVTCLLMLLALAVLAWKIDSPAAVQISAKPPWIGVFPAMSGLALMPALLGAAATLMTDAAAWLGLSRAWAGQERRFARIFPPTQFPALARSCQRCPVGILGPPAAITLALALELALSALTRQQFRLTYDGWWAAACMSLASTFLILLASLATARALRHGKRLRIMCGILAAERDQPLHEPPLNGLLAWDPHSAALMRFPSTPVLVQPDMRENSPYCVRQFVYATFSREIHLMRWSLALSSLNAIVVISLLYLYPMTASSLLAMLSLGLMGTNAMIFARQRKRLEACEALRLLICNRKDASSGQMAQAFFILLPSLIALITAFVVIAVPGVLENSGNLLELLSAFSKSAGR